MCEPRVSFSRVRARVRSSANTFQRGFHPRRSGSLSGVNHTNATAALQGQGVLSGGGEASVSPLFLPGAMHARSGGGEQRASGSCKRSEPGTGARSPEPLFSTLTTYERFLPTETSRGTTRRRRALLLGRGSAASALPNPQARFWGCVLSEILALLVWRE